MTIQELVSCKGTIIKETEKAVYFEFHDISGEVLEDKPKHWVPLSQVPKRTISHNEGEDTMMLFTWIAQKLKII